MAYTLIAFLFAIFLLVTLHELGHFMAARLCGVKVLRFSFGFGKVLARGYDRKGTEYALSLWPLGGYVKMLDEREGTVALDEKHLAFNRQSVWVRIWIVCAGPLMNMLFAWFALWLVLVIGIQTLAPMIDDVKINSVAAQMGFQPQEEILSLNHKPIRSWRDFQFALLPYLGGDAIVPMTLKSLSTGKTRTLEFNTARLKINDGNTDFLTELGIQPFIPSVPLVVGELLPNSAAMHAGMRVGDTIAAINGHALNDWLTLVETVQAHPNRVLQFTIMRQGQVMDLPVHIGSQIHEGKVQGQLGVKSQPAQWPKQWLRVQREAPLAAVLTAMNQTVELTGATFSMIGRLLIGQMDLKHISGPVGIAQGAGQSARSGLSYYLSFLALISISLGVLNLLPIPMLDGGHVLYYLIEVFTRRPVSYKVQAIGMMMGITCLAALTILAFRNDVLRLFG